MSLFDKLIGEISPQSEEARRRARLKAQALAEPHDWLALILEQHLKIDAAFAAVARAPGPASRRAALKSLAVLITAHANAEETVIYPALLRVGRRGPAMAGYREQAQAKVRIAGLEYLDPVAPKFLREVHHVHHEVAHHIYAEENGRLLELKLLTAREQEALSQRFRQEFERYMRRATVLPTAPAANPPPASP